MIVGQFHEIYLKNTICINALAPSGEPSYCHDTGIPAKLLNKKGMTLPLKLSWQHSYCHIVMALPLEFESIGGKAVAVVPGESTEFSFFNF